jgi:hypothetical protein
MYNGGGLKACRSGGVKKGSAVDGGQRNRRGGDQQNCRKIKQQAKNYKKRTSKYKTNIELKEQQDKKKKKTTGKQKQIQTKTIARGTPEHELAGNH